jgi:negative regulator of flagellin synthesis FlgM
MTDAINSANRAARVDLLAETARLKKAEESEKFRKAQVPTSESVKPATNEVQLSNVSSQAMRGPDYDEQRVEQIKQAIRDGNYPLDARRIAESFAALEKLI